MDGPRYTFLIYKQSQVTRLLVIISNIFAGSLGLNGLDLEGWPYFWHTILWVPLALSLLLKETHALPSLKKLFRISYRHYKHKNQVFVLK